MKSQTRARIVTFGFGETHDIRASNVRLDWPCGTRFTLHVGKETRELAVRLLGQHMLYPVLAAVAVAHAEGLPLDPLLPLLELLPPTRGRMELITLPNGAWIIRDDTKSAFETIHAALDVLAQIPNRRRILALGDVTEPPDNQGRVHQAIGEKFATIVSLAVVITGNKNRRSYAIGAERRGLARAAIRGVGHSAQQAAAILREELQPGDVLLIKGRFDQRLERIALVLLGRKVQCDIARCRVKMTECADCPMLERGWQGLPPVT